MWLGWSVPCASSCKTIYMVCATIAMRLSADRRPWELLVSRTTLQATCMHEQCCCWRSRDLVMMLLNTLHWRRPYTHLILIAEEKLKRKFDVCFLWKCGICEDGSAVWAWREAWGRPGPGQKKWYGMFQLCRLHCGWAMAVFGKW